MWTGDLDENEQLEQQNLALEKDVGNYKKQLVSNLRDNASRITEQRLHMLKCLHYLPEDKKKAAKFLIEEMVTME
jgi:Fe2+ or Zn2+ uptake regulation protein